VSITRKEFFLQSFLSLGRTAFDIAETLKGGNAVVPAQSEEESLPPQPCPDMVAESFNERCLARSCGCIACEERCEPQAIMIVPGQGIRIDQTRCSGCGMCEYVCPVSPKAVIMSPRKV
jgi:ferredoxin